MLLKAQGPLTEPGAADLTGLAGQRNPKTLRSPLPQGWGCCCVLLC
ncbi:hypothetical protein LEMLEM_LOCUS27675 [Lemmus lemmus]